jgi:hypothetical protein
MELAAVTISPSLAFGCRRCVCCTEHAAYISEVAVVPCPKRLPALLKVTPAGAALEHRAFRTTEVAVAGWQAVQPSLHIPPHRGC